MVTSGKISTGKGLTKTAISSVSKLSEHKAIRESQRKAGASRSKDSNDSGSESVNSEVAYSVDASSNYKVSYDSEALQNFQLGQALRFSNLNNVANVGTGIAPLAGLGGAGAVGDGLARVSSADSNWRNNGAFGGGGGGGGGIPGINMGDLRGNLEESQAAGSGNMSASLKELGEKAKEWAIDAKDWLVTAVNGTTSNNYAWMDSGGAMLDYFLDNKIKGGMSFGEAILSAHGADLGKSRATTAGADMPRDAGTASNPFTHAIYLADLQHPQHGGWFANSFRRFKQRAIEAGVPPENVKLAGNVQDYEKHLVNAAIANKEAGGGGGLMLGQFNHGYSNGIGRNHTPDATSGFMNSRQWITEGRFETMNAIAKAYGQFDFASCENKSCFGGGFDGEGNIKLAELSPEERQEILAEREAAKNPESQLAFDYENKENAEESQKDQFAL